MQGSELWKCKFSGLLLLVKEYIVDVWEIRKHKLYDSDSGFGQHLHSQSSPGDLAVVEGQRNGKFSRNGKLGHSCARVQGQRSCYCAFRFKCKQLHPKLWVRGRWR